jgi:hypothetical protein
MTGKRPSMNLVSIYLLPIKWLSGACSPTLCSKVVLVECACATKCMPFLKARLVAKSCRSIAGKKLFPVLDSTITCHMLRKRVLLLMLATPYLQCKLHSMCHC